MNTKPMAVPLLRLLSAVITLEAASPAFPQGSLTPPGPPAPTMKSLDQIETRTPISSAPYTISASGSYYLTNNMSVSSGNAITIAANGVTLDLNGFTISSTAASATGNAILLNSGLRNITIKNGFIQSGVVFSGGTYAGSGFDSGINYTGTAPETALVSHVSVSGVLNHGMTLGSGNSTVAEACNARTGGGYGIVAAAVRDCSAIQWGITAIFGNEVSNSRGASTAGFDGISASTAQNCYGESNSGNGFTVDTAINCSGKSLGSGTGISAWAATNCRGESTNGWGISATLANNCYAHSSNSFALSASNAINCRAANDNGSTSLFVTFAAFCTWSGTGSYNHAYFCGTGNATYP